MAAEAVSSLRELNRILRILLVEYNLKDQRVMGLLEESGYRVQMAANGQEALAALGDQRFDIVLMDIEPLEIKGIETIAAIRYRETATGGHLPIVAVTSHTLEQERERCLQAGVDACVSKPIQLPDLLRTIEKLTGPTLRDSGHPVRSGYALTKSLKLLAEIQAAIGAGDVNTIRHTADALKGSITSVLAKEAFEAVSTLEKTVHEVELASAKDACRRLRAAITSLNPMRTRKIGD